MSSVQSTSFAEYVRDLEGRMTDDERAELDSWRDYYRRLRGDDEPPAVREPRR